MRPSLVSQSPGSRGSLRDGVAVLAARGAELRVPFRIAADPVGLKPGDLPIATGAQPPQARGSAPLVVGLRDPAHTLAFARAAGLLAQLDLRAAAAAPATPMPPGAAGALTARLRSSVLATQIPELIRARIGDLTAWARAELTGITGELRLALR